MNTQNNDNAQIDLDKTFDEGFNKLLINEGCVYLEFQGYDYTIALKNDNIEIKRVEDHGVEYAIGEERIDVSIYKHPSFPRLRFTQNTINNLSNDTSNNLLKNKTINVLSIDEIINVITPYLKEHHDDKSLAYIGNVKNMKRNVLCQDITIKEMLKKYQSKLTQTYNQKLEKIKNTKPITFPLHTNKFNGKLTHETNGTYSYTHIVNGGLPIKISFNRNGKIIKTEVNLPNDIINNVPEEIIEANKNIVDTFQQELRDKLTQKNTDINTIQEFFNTTYIQSFQNIFNYITLLRQVNYLSQQMNDVALLLRRDDIYPTCSEISSFVQSKQKDICKSFQDIKQSIKDLITQAQNCLTDKNSIKVLSEYLQKKYDNTLLQITQFVNYNFTKKTLYMEANNNTQIESINMYLDDNMQTNYLEVISKDEKDPNIKLDLDIPFIWKGKKRQLKDFAFIHNIGIIDKKNDNIDANNHEDIIHTLEDFNNIAKQQLIYKQLKKDYDFLISKHSNNLLTIIEEFVKKQPNNKNNEHEIIKDFAIKYNNPTLYLKAVMNERRKRNKKVDYQKYFGERGWNNSANLKPAKALNTNFGIGRK